MKLHLPKSLFIAVLAAVVSTPLLTWGETITMNPFKETGWHEAYRYDKNASNKDLGTITIDNNAGTAVLGGGWNQNRATYVLDELMQADQSTALTFSLSITPGGSGGLYGIALVGKHQTIAFGDLDYDETKLQYGVGDDVTGDFYHKKGSDWDNGVTGGEIQTSPINDITSTGGQTYKLDGAIEWDATQNTYVMTLTYNDVATPAATVNLGSSADVSKIIVYTDGVSATFSSFTLTGAAGSLYDLIWGGSNGNNTWSSLASPWQGGADGSSASDYILFDALSGDVTDTVIISGNVEAKKISINDDYSFKADGEGSISTALGIEIADGKKMGVTGGTLTINGSITGDVSVNGGNLNISGQEAIGGGKLEIQNGTVQASLDAQSNMSVIKAGTEISIKTGGVLHLKGHDMLGWGSASPEKILLKSESSADDKLAKLHFEEDEDTGATTLASDIEMQGNTLVTGNAINTFGTDFIASKTNNTIAIGEIKVRNTLNIDVKSDGDELIISSNLTAYSGAASNIVKKGEGTLTLSGSNSYTGGTRVEAGTLIVSQGSSLGSGDIDVTGGELQVSGAGAITATNLNISNGTVVASYSGSGDSVISHDTTVNVGTGGTLKLTGHDMLGWSADAAPAKIVLKGESSLDGSRSAKLDIQDTEVHTGVAPIEMKGYSELTGTKYSTFASGITVEGTNNKITVAELQMRNDLALSIAKDAVLTIESMIKNHTYGRRALSKSGEGTLVITNSKNEWNGAMQVTGGTLRLEGAAKLDGSVTMASGTRLEIGTGTIGSLDMAGGSTLDADEPVSVKGALTLGTGINLEGGIVNALYSGAGKVTLFTGITSLSMGGTTYDPSASVAYTPVDITRIFTIENMEGGRYNLYYEGGELFAGLTAAVPEPATATLSLLALAGLCARRRRKA